MRNLSWTWNWLVVSGWVERSRRTTSRWIHRFIEYSLQGIHSIFSIVFRRKFCYECSELWIISIWNWLLWTLRDKTVMRLIHSEVRPFWCYAENCSDINSIIFVSSERGLIQIVNGRGWLIRKNQFYMQRLAVSGADERQAICFKSWRKVCFKQR